MARSQIWMSAGGRYGSWIPCMEGGMDKGMSGVIEASKYSDGGSFVYRAPAAAKTYGATWVGTDQELQPIREMFKGSYGPGPFYFIDPMAKTNVLPAHWADPYLSSTIGGWPPLVRGVKGVQLTTAISSAYTPPTFSASYTMVGAPPIFNVLTPRCTVAIPPTSTLRLTFWGSRSGSGNAVYRINSYNRSTGLTTYTDVVPTATGATASFAGSTFSHIEIWITKLTSADATIVCAGTVANIAAGAATTWYPGEGHGGLEFSDALGDTAYQAEVGNLKSWSAITATFEEIGPWK